MLCLCLKGWDNIGPEKRTGAVAESSVQYGDVSTDAHPYLILEVNTTDGYCEVTQMDSLEGKEFKALLKSNKIIPCRNPQETVFNKNGYAQLDNTFRFELYDGLERFRRTEDVLSKVRFDDVSKAYRKYHEEHEIDENKNVFMTQSEIESLN